MDILFVGGIYPEERLDEISRKSKKKLSYASNLHQWNIINGIESNLGKPITILNSYFIGYFPKYRDLIIKSYKWEHAPDSRDINTGFLNIRGIRQFSRYISVKKVLSDFIKNNIDMYVILYTLDYSFLRATYELKKDYPMMKICAIVPDLPLIISQYGQRRSLYSKISSEYNIKKIESYLSVIDKYVIVAEPMKELLHIKEGDYCVVDGLFDSKNNKTIDDNIELYNKPTIVYTGSLHREYGICELISAFCLIRDDNYKLIIAGSGNAEEEVRKATEEDPRIEYLGILRKNEVLELQNKATILINPRLPSGIDANYSFPSKTIEYMLSGRPVLMFQLPGMSDIYFNYVYTFKSENIKEMSDTMIEVCSKNCKELNQKGMEARNFIIEHNNSKIQTQKILEVLKQI